MGVDYTVLSVLLVKIAVMASMASLLLRWGFAKRMLLRERRSIQQRLELGLLFGFVFAIGTMLRLVLKYDAAELALEGSFVAGLVGGYVVGAVTGVVAALPAILPPGNEWVAFPLLLGVGALGGFLRDIAPGAGRHLALFAFLPVHDQRVGASAAGVGKRLPNGIAHRGGRDRVPADQPGACV